MKSNLAQFLNNSEKILISRAKNLQQFAATVARSPKLVRQQFAAFKFLIL
ncbi:MAG: hypothetical protein F6K32_10430 [Desertifilum sp. SIO1I2]|nr:hypothetical protein [Desertifilum sp. SIO1I2]